MRHILIASLLLFSNVSAAEQYLCTTEKITGFIHGTQNWELVTIKPENQYVISFSPDSPQYAIHKTDATKSDYYCPAGFNDQGILLCKGFSVETTYDTFVFNRKNNRFTFSNVSFSYAFVGTQSKAMDLKITEDNADGSVFAIGTCKVTL